MNVFVFVILFYFIFFVQKEKLLRVASKQFNSCRIVGRRTLSLVTFKKEKKKRELFGVFV